MIVYYNIIQYYYYRAPGLRRCRPWISRPRIRVQLYYATYTKPALLPYYIRYAIYYKLQTLYDILFAARRTQGRRTSKGFE